MGSMFVPIIFICVYVFGLLFSICIVHLILSALPASVQTERSFQRAFISALTCNTSSNFPSVNKKYHTFYRPFFTDTSHFHATTQHQKLHLLSRSHNIGRITPDRPWTTQHRHFKPAMNIVVVDPTLGSYQDRAVSGRSFSVCLRNPSLMGRWAGEAVPDSTAPWAGDGSEMAGEIEPSLAISGHNPTHCRRRRSDRKRINWKNLLRERGKHGMPVNVLKVTKNIANSNLESLWVRIKIDKKKAATLVCIYRPPSTNHFQIESESQLQQIIAASTCDRIIIAGDFNADSQTNPAAYRRLVQLERYGLKCVVNEPTFYRDFNSSVLDVALVSNALCTQISPETCVVQKCDYITTAWACI